MITEMNKTNKSLKDIIDKAQNIVIIQADNPDGDSLASALALEQILHQLGKNPHMYCGVDMPEYLRYLRGWDRVYKEIPKSFDASIIVDASSLKLLEKITNNQMQGWVAARPCLVLDHHPKSKDAIDFARVTINDTEVSSTGELIYKLAKQFNWPLDKTSGEFIMTAILSDTQGLTNDLTSANTYKIMAELLDLGVDRPKLEEKRREFSKMKQVIFKYKAKLIERTEFFADDQIAFVDVPHSEIKEFSPLYNPAPLIQGDMLQTEGVGVAIVFKKYDNSRITAAIRCNEGFEIADKLAEYFGGGGHPYASGFKIQDGKSLSEIKKECIATATKLIKELK